MSRDPVGCFYFSWVFGRGGGVWERGHVVGRGCEVGRGDEGGSGDEGWVWSRMKYEISRM